MTVIPPRQIAGTDINSLAFLSAGSAQARSLSARFTDEIDLLDYIVAIDADATNGFNRAVAEIQALGIPKKLKLTAGVYNISGSIPISMTAQQGIFIEGDSSGSVTIIQNADADVFDVTLNNFGGVLATGAFGVTGVRFQMAAAGSTTRKAISLTSTAVSGAAGVPVAIDDIIFASTSTTSYWGNGLLVNEIPDAVYISRIKGYYVGQNAGGVHISINGASGAYTTSVFMSDTFLVNGLKGHELGNYLQGIHGRNLNTIGTAFALYAAPNAGIDVEYQILDSYLDGKTLITNTNGGSIGAIKLANNYFDALNGVNSGETHVSLVGMTTLSLCDNTYVGSATVSNITGLSISGPNVTPASAIGEKITGYANGGTGVALNLATYTMTLVGTMISGCTTPITDSSSVNNNWSCTTVNNAYFSIGHIANDGLQITASVAGSLGTNLGVANILAAGADPNIAILFSAKGLPNVDFYFRDGLARNLLQLLDNQVSGSGLGASLKQGSASASVNFRSDTGTNLLVGAPAPATSATSGFMQMATMAGAPTGTPATNDGASIVYDTTNHKLWAYDTGTSTWKGVVLS